ncbi:MAG: tRNA (adenosine(37)-N6)-threonylcarbamoyltransferase complex dimerization subunit type 1 TsaB [Parcubacteria group bacterium]|nr:tRNA (adenosine(37)-N6)-threonylcarbamoyltransferase complex dimerization subunit type 1 TsaB [Parcubacteria group bacterium]
MHLIIDTSSKKSLIVKASKGNFEKKVFGSNFDHSEKLLIEVSKILNSRLKNLEGIAVISGPGSYTGLRVGIATSNALGYSLDLPVVDVNRLEWLAHMGILNKDKNIQICSVLSAIHDSIFAGLYDYKDGLLKQKGEFISGTIDELFKVINKPTLFIVEDVDILKEIVSENILKKKLNSNFIDLKYINFYNKDVIEKLIEISLEKFKKCNKGQIIKPLYIQKPNITHPKK